MVNVEKNSRMKYASTCLKFVEAKKKNFDLVIKDPRCLGPGDPGIYCGMDYGFEQGEQYKASESLAGDEDIRDVCAKRTLNDFDEIPRHLDGVSDETGLEIPDEFK
nr:hypothetical protein [Candidatus Sigynarchaeum springense]